MGLFQLSGTKSAGSFLSVDETQMSLIHLTEMKAVLTVFHFRVFVREDVFDLQTSDRVFKVGCKKAFSRTRGGKRGEIAEEDTGQYLDSPKSESERCHFWT